MNQMGVRLITSSQEAQPNTHPYTHKHSQNTYYQLQSQPQLYSSAAQYSTVQYSIQ